MIAPLGPCGQIYVSCAELDPTCCGLQPLVTQVDLTSIVQTTADYRLNNFIGGYEIEKFAAPSEIDVRYFDAPYYIIPDDEVGLEAFAVIRDAMASKKMVGMKPAAKQRAKA
jgi:Ku70/Ku80 beta-barrel domain